jgi:hypothetical protein
MFRHGLDTDSRAERSCMATVPCVRQPGRKGISTMNTCLAIVLAALRMTEDGDG